MPSLLPHPVLALAISPALCALGIVQVLCVAAAGVTRLTEGTRHERGGQWLFLFALAVAGGLCGAAIQCGPDSAAVCAATLALMTLIAVADFSATA
jgi:hypothetical protein